MINLHHKLKWTVCQPAQHCHSGFYFNSDSSISPVFGALSSLLHRALAQFHNFSIVHRCMHFLAHCPTLTKAHQHWPTVFHSPSCKSGWNRKQHPRFYSFFFLFFVFCTGFLKVVTNALHNVCSASSDVLLFHCTPLPPTPSHTDLPFHIFLIWTIQHWFQQNLWWFPQAGKGTDSMNKYTKVTYNYE